jgi:hypothetical protein
MMGDEMNFGGDTYEIQKISRKYYYSKFEISDLMGVVKSKASRKF